MNFDLVKMVFGGLGLGVIDLERSDDKDIFEHYLNNILSRNRSK